MPSIIKRSPALVFILLFLFNIYAFSQQPAQPIPSIHQTERLLHPAERLSPEDVVRTENAIPLNKNVDGLSSTVFGYLPYWEYPSALSYLQYDLLSHIAVFDFQAFSNGYIDLPADWPWTDLINTAHQNGTKVIITVVSFNASTIHAILTNESVKEDFFANVLAIIEADLLDGVNIDFEGLYTEDSGNILNAFMLELSNFLHNANPDYEVSIAAPPVNWGGWDFTGLSMSCDYIFIMGYNYYGSWSTTSGANAPLTGGSINIMSTVLSEYGEVTQTTPEKLILGVPYYGNRWETATALPYSQVIDYIDHPLYESAMNNAEQDGLLWDNVSQTSYSVYENNDYYEQTWFDTDSSLGRKYDLAEQYELKGVGMWALGYDGVRTELWDELRQRYFSPVGIEEMHLTDFGSTKVFPNPFFSSTSLEIELNAAADVSVKVFDTQGRLLPHSFFEFSFDVGKHRIPVDLSGFPVGVYFLKLHLVTYKGDYSVSEVLLRVE